MSEEIMLERVCQILASIFNIPSEQVHADTSSATLEAWESMGHLMLILEIEQEFGVQFAPEQVEQMHDVKTIVQTLQSIL